MNMYRDSYVVALMVDGKVQKESQNGEVLLPFGSEYVIRLKNKLRKRAVADVYIDGRAAVQGIVVDSNGTVDLERFVENGNLLEGKKFKLVRVSDPKVEQPYDSECGIIEVNFYSEKDVPVIEKTIIHDYTHHNYLCNGHCPQCCFNWCCQICHPNYKWYCGDTICGSGGIQSGLTSVNSSIDLNGASVSMNNVTYSAASQVSPTNSGIASNAMNSTSVNLGESAATVGGSTSLQKFSSISIEVDRSKPVTIRLTVKGINKLIDVCSCGYKRKKNTKYCPNDGTQLMA